MFKKLVTKLLIWLSNWLRINNKVGVKFMYIVKADNPEVGFVLEFDAFDSEGNVVSEDDLIVTVESDNDEAVEVEFDEETLEGKVIFGSPGLANINATVETLEGVLLGSFGAQFTVVAGDPKSISGGKLSFKGLTEVVEEPAPVVEEEKVPVEETEA